MAEYDTRAGERAPIVLTLYPKGTASAPCDVEAFADSDEGWTELCEAVAELTRREAKSKLAMAALSPHVLREGTERANHNVDHVTLIALDLDSAVELEPILATLEGFAYLIYGTPSDAPDARRVRIFVRASRPILPSECAHTRLVLAEILGFAPGCGVEKCLDPARIFFAGKLRGTPDRYVSSACGGGLDVDALMASPLEHPWKAPPPRLAPPAEAPALRPATSPDALDAALAAAREAPPSISGQGGDQALFDAARAIARIVPEDADAVEYALREEFNPRCDPPWPRAKLKREASRAAAREAAPEARAVRRLEAARAAARPDAPAALSTLDLDINKQGTPKATHLNVGRIIEHVFGEAIRFEAASGRIQCSEVDETLGYFPVGEWSDAHTTSLVQLCEGLDVTVSPGVVDRAVELHARQHEYNAMRDGLFAMALTWDGAPRADQFFADYWGAEDNAATRAVSRVFLLSLVARGLEPGIKVDTCPVIIGVQGAFKSSALRALVGGEFFADSPLQIGDKDAAQAIRGVLLWELQEGAGVNRREQDHVKAFLSQREDRYRASYGRHTTNIPRTCTFAISINEEDGILRDPTGARRYLPVKVHDIDIRGITDDRQQILGEAAARVLGGEQHWPTNEETAALAPVREDYSERDEWLTAIALWAERRGGGSFTIGDVCDQLTGAIPMPERDIDRGVQTRIGICLRALGATRTIRGHRRDRVWLLSGGDTPRPVRERDNVVGSKVSLKQRPSDALKSRSA